MNAYQLLQHSKLMQIDPRPVNGVEADASLTVEVLVKMLFLLVVILYDIDLNDCEGAGVAP